MISDKTELTSSLWDDFQVGSKNSSTAFDMYESYKLFKEGFNSMPKSELIERGLIKDRNDSSSLTDLFMYVHQQKKNGATLFRRMESANEYLCLLWLSRVKTEAEFKLVLDSIPKFEGIDKIFLKSLTKLSVTPESVLELPEVLKKKGIILIYSKAFSGIKLDGAIFKLWSGTPVIGLSLRYKRLDNFWFTLMHELAHLCTDSTILDEPRLHDMDVTSDSPIELKANRLAKYSFVNKNEWRVFKSQGHFTNPLVSEFSERIGVHRAIIAGMLGRETGNYRGLVSKLVNEIDVRELIFDDA